MDRVELIIQLTGDKEATRSLENLLKVKDELNDKKIKLQVERNQLNQEINKIKRDLNELTSKKHQIKLNADEAREIDRRIAQIRIDLRALSNIKTRIKLEGGDVTEINRVIHSVKTELNELVQRRHDIKVAADDEILEIDRQIKDLKANLNELTERKHEINVTLEGHGMAIKEAEELAQNFGGAGQQALALADAIKSLGIAMQSIGNISGRIGKFAGGIGDYFNSMSELFKINIFDKIGTRLAELGTDAFVGQIGNITSRYDILSTFTDYMNLAGVASDDAAVALQRVNDSILGLPIGLDESAQRLRRYQMFLGDVNDATNLTIGLQKALYAGGANEQMRTTALYEIERLLSAGDLSTGRQWNALMQGFGVSMNYVAEEMGFAGDSVGELSEKLHSGQIPAQEFLQALMRLGEGSSEAAGKLDNALNIYKGTLESWISNIQFAVTRGAANMLTTLDQALTEGLGKGVAGYLETVRDGINDAFSGMNNWMLSNSDAFTRIVESVEGMLSALKRFSAGDLARSVFDNLARGIDMVTQALNRLPVGLTEQFIAFATTLAGPLGSLFKTIAAGAPIVLGIFDRFKSFNFEMLLDKIITQVERLAGAVSFLLGLIPDGMLGDLIASGLVWGKPIEQALTSIGKVIESIGNAKAGGAATNIVGLIVQLASAHPMIAAAAAALTALGLAVGHFLSAAESEAGDILKEWGFDEYAADIEHAAHAVQEAGNLIDAQSRNFDEINAKLDIGKRLANEIMELNKASATDDGAFESLKSKVAELISIYPGLSIKIDENIRKLTNESAAVLRGADAYMEYQAAIEKAESAKEYLKELSEEKLKLEIDQVVLEESLAEAKRKIDEFIQSIRDKNKLFPDNPDIEAKLNTVPDAMTLGEGKALDAMEVEYKELEAALQANIGAQEELDARMSATNTIIDEASDKVQEYKDVVAGASDAQEGLAGSTKDTEAALKTLQDAYGRLREEAEKTISKQVAGFAKLEEAAATSAAVIAENLNSNTDYLSSYGDNLAAILQYMQENADKLSATDMKMFAEIASGGLDMAAEADALVKSIGEGDFSALSKAYEAKITEELRAIDLSAAIQAISEQFTEQFDTLTAKGSLFGENGFTLFSEKDMELIQEQAAEQGQKILEAMRSVFTGEGVDGAETEGSLFGEDGFTLFSEKDIELIQEQAAEQGQKILEAMRSAFTGEGVDGAEAMTLFDEETVAAMFEPLTEAIAGDEGIVIRLGELQEQMISITEETIPSMVSAFEGLRDAAMDLTDNGIEPLREKEEETEEQTDELRDAIIDLADTMNEKIGTIEAFTAAIDTMRASVEESTAAVRELQAAIDALQDKTITITTNFVGGVTGGFGWASPAGRSTGGPIYRDRGGAVLFKPKGTDTVPAMLTPGEYVVRREAVKRLGTTFFDRINRLDIDAAFDRVYKHFNRPLSYVPVYNAVTHRNDNRNITVTQNIHSDHPDYPLRIASRWANAL